MQGVTLAELRDLSLWSRRAQRVGGLGSLAVLLAIPAQFMFAAWIGATWAAAVVVAVGGVAFVAYAFAAGQERGAFRRVFRRIADDKRRSRSFLPEEAPALMRAEA